MQLIKTETTKYSTYEEVKCKQGYQSNFGNLGYKMILS